jgi:4-hydroxybenzoate polyprenyltransferase
LSLFSLDVALGAVSSAVFASLLISGEIPSMNHLLTLFFAVIGIYTFDHLFDLGRIEFPDLSERRQFHLKYKNLLIGVSLFSLATAGFLSLTLPIAIQISGFIIAAFMLAYFLVVQKMDTQHIKDIGVSLGYMSGIWFPFLAFYGTWTDSEVWLQLLLFVMNTLQIMMIYAKVDATSDYKEQLESLVQSRKWFYWLASKIGPAFILVFLWAMLERHEQSVLLAIIPGAQYVLIRWVFSRYNNKLTPETVRYWGEYSYLIYLISLATLWVEF